MSTSPIKDDKEIYIEDEYLKCESQDAETTCDICMAEFIDPTDLEIHLLQVHNVSGSSKHGCDFCPASCADLMTYAEHIRDNHILSLFTCKYCYKVFTDFDIHRKHEKKHLVRFNKRVYTCSQCSQMFGILQELRNHEYSQHNNRNDGVPFKDYLPYLSAALNIKATSFLECLGSNMVYICVKCEYTTDNANNFVQHGQLSKCVTYVCNNCSNSYKKKKNLYRHLARECIKDIKNMDRIETCPECKIDFYQSDFKVHTKTCHIIKCSICNITLDTMYELSKHQAKEHPLSIDLTSCQFCWKQCVGTVALQKHIDRSHRGEFHMYKYLCVHCQSIFKHPKKLFSHYFTNHKDLNPYTCKICNMEFRIRKKFTIHIKMKHDSQGFVEFDESYHVFFTDTRSENPFIPKSVISDDDQREQETDTSKKLGIDSDNIIATETEDNQTEAETKVKPVRKSQRVRTRSRKLKKDVDPVSIESSEDEPLLAVRKWAQKKLLSKQQKTKMNKLNFTCNICKKYCYTYQNYNHHMTLHSSDIKKCIKCPQVFRSKSKLQEHIARHHSKSKLTETLKVLLEKRKAGVPPTITEISMSEKFKRTIKKVEMDHNTTAAKIVPVENGLSVQKFIENFSPEETKTEPIIENEVSLKVVTGPYKKPLIKMTKFDPKPMNFNAKLSMPVKFKGDNTEKVNVTIKLVQPSTNLEESEDNNDYYDVADHRDEIPEVAEEIMLEDTYEPPKPKPVAHKIIIDKIPKEYTKMRIAHMLSEGPYFKIVKLNDVLKTPEKEEPIPENINLPDGTKLVSTNPLAHLLGDTPVEKLVEKKYYKSKLRDVHGILTKAWMKLDQQTPPKKKKNVD